MRTGAWNGVESYADFKARVEAEWAAEIAARPQVITYCDMHFSAGGCDECPRRYIKHKCKRNINAECQG